MNVIEAPSSAFRIGGSRQRSGSVMSTVTGDDEEYPTRHHSYVPSVSLPFRAPPSVSTLINLKQRYHFHCPSFSSAGTGSESKGDTNTEEFMSPDLGTTVLQGIILQMKTSRLSLSQLPSHQGDGSVTQLDGYCKYLRGGRPRLPQD